MDVRVALPGRGGAAASPRPTAGFRRPHRAPVRGETIPIRLFLGGFDLTPTFRDVSKKFSARYYLNLVLNDEENRRYFKQQEITFYRIPDNG